MVNITAAINFWGTAFAPGRTELATGLPFTQKSEVGSVGTTGRYRNQPLPYGWASFEAPGEVEPSDRVLWVARQWIGKIDLARQQGAEDIQFWVGYYYKDQCNCALSVEEIRAIEALSIPYLFSVYQTDHPDAIP